MGIIRVPVSAIMIIGFYYFGERTLQSCAGENEVRETCPPSSGALRISRHPPSYQHLSQCLAQSRPTGGGRRRECASFSRAPDKGWFHVPQPHAKEAAAHNSVERGLGGRACPEEVGHLLAFRHLCLATKAPSDIWGSSSGSVPSWSDHAEFPP